MFQSSVKQKPFIISLPHITCKIWTNTAFPPPNTNIVNVHFLSVLVQFAEMKWTLIIRSFLIKQRHSSPANLTLPKLQSGHYLSVRAQFTGIKCWWTQWIVKSDIVTTGKICRLTSTYVTIPSRTSHIDIFSWNLDFYTLVKSIHFPYKWYQNYANHHVPRSELYHHFFLSSSSFCLHFNSTIKSQAKLHWRLSQGRCTV